MLRDATATMVAELPGPCRFRAGDEVHITTPEARLNLFDAESGINLERDL
jgi:hypothetical protein